MKKIFCLWMICFVLGGNAIKAQESEPPFLEACVLSSESQIHKSPFFKHVKEVVKTIYYVVTGLPKAPQPIIYISKPANLVSENKQDKMGTPRDSSRWKVTLFRPDDGNEESNWREDKLFLGLTLERAF